ncbi:MAG: hypothetical protein JWP89_85 [Schlesneria sp.]|nr:hypothetical protein [Schlesneria sp.]
MCSPLHLRHWLLHNRQSRAGANRPLCHSRAGGNPSGPQRISRSHRRRTPLFRHRFRPTARWIPAGAGMTRGTAHLTELAVLSNMRV